MNSEHEHRPRLLAADNWVLADIGGTYTRLCAYAPPGPAGEVVRVRNDEFDGPKSLVSRFCAERRLQPDGAALAVAGPVDSDEFRWTNRSWSISISRLREELGLQRLWVVNDFAANAAALYALPDSERRLLGAPPTDGWRDAADEPVLILGPGTGLGAAAYLRDGQRPRVLPSEAGHMTCSFTDAAEDELRASARAAWGRISWERLLSGPGLSWLGAHYALESHPLETADVVRAARHGAPWAMRAVGTFSSLLGSFAGDLCLALHAGGGVYLTGGVVDGLADLLNVPALRAGFESKGRFADWLARVPVYRLLTEYPALRGLAAVVAGEVRTPGILRSA